MAAWVSRSSLLCDCFAAQSGMCTDNAFEPIMSLGAGPLKNDC